MNLLGISKYIEDWLANHETRANSMSLKIQRIRDEYIEICIHGNVLLVTIPPNFFTSCSADGIISHPDCAFAGMLAEQSIMDSTGPALMGVLNERLDRLSSRGSYSLSSVLDSILDTFENYCSDSDGEIDEEDEEEDAWLSDGEGYFGDLGTTGTVFHSVQSHGSRKNGYFSELIEDANKKCDEARSLAMSAISEVPCNKNMKNDILRCCQVYSPRRSNLCVGFEIELSGLLSEYYRHRHGHVFEALGFSFATPLLVEAMFEPDLCGTSKSVSLETPGELIGRAFSGLGPMHGQIERKFVDGVGDPTGQDDPDVQIAKVMDKPSPIHMYGLESLLPRMAKYFFCQHGRNPDNVLLECEDNIFVTFLLFTGSRLASLLKRCIVCNKELPFTVSRLCSCADELCLYSFEVLGLGAQVLQEVIRMPIELIDLEISLALSAAEGSRDVFEPFPPFLLKEREIRQRSQLLNDEDNANPIPKPNSWTVRTQRRDSQKQRSRNKNKNIDVLRSIIKSFPPVSEMRLCTNETNLKAKLAKSWLCTPEGKSAEKSGDKYFRKEVWQLPYNVLRFMLCTNRLSLVFLSDNDDKLLKVDDSQFLVYQFAVVQDSPEREAVYIESYRNKQEVSIFGFHGSRRENWYSILRNGLRCLSNTKLMSTGCSLGEGIYLTNTFEYSANYAGYLKRSSAPAAWMNGMYLNGFYVVSVCEVISSPTIKKSSGIYVVPKEHEGSVAVRYLLVCARPDDLILKARIVDGHILLHGGNMVDLFQHYQSIRQKYACGSCSQ